MNTRFISFFLVVFMCAAAGCANISSPTGGKRDVKPPKLLSVSPKDSLLNTRVKRLELHFDEYIVVSDVQKEVEISPILLISPTVSGINKHVTLKIEDSLLEANTTYRISFGAAIKDLHEGNAFPNYTYTFSTGSFFDSLQLSGDVVDGATGLPDTGAIVVLYNSTENDSAILKKKPKYKAKADSRGMFAFKGLPAKTFRIYAIKDENDNLTYDGGNEMVAFHDSTVYPTDSAMGNITLRVFTEIPDTTIKKDTVAGKPKTMRGKSKAAAAIADTNLTYTINIDTTNINKRTFDITDSIKLVFNRIPAIAKEKISIIYDSADAVLTLPINVRQSTSTPGTVYITTLRWKENRVYTLRFAEGFATDTSGKSTVATQYKFRTFNDDDYGKITLNVPGKYNNKAALMVNASAPDYVLMMNADNDTLYQQKITDTVINFKRLKPAKYTFRIIVDKNKDGVWNTGDLLAKRQPELVIPSNTSVPLKARFEHTVDFEPKPKPIGKAGGLKEKTLPKK